MAQGQIYTTSDTTTTKRAVADYVHMIDPMDVPCVSYFGTNNGSKFRIVNLPNHKYAWLEDNLRTRTTTLNDGTFAASASETSCTVTDGTIFKPGDVILIDDEKLWVSAVSTNTLTVERGWGSTSGATHTNGSTMTYLFSARLEGDDSDPAFFTTPSEVYNQSQIFHWEIRVTGSEQDATTRYGISDTYKYQMMKALGGLGGGNGQRGRAGDLMIDLEKTFFYGERIARSGSSTAGGMGGVNTFLSTNTTDLSGAIMQEDDLMDAIQDCWTQGGKPRTILLNAFNKRVINSWYRDELQRERSDRTGGLLINTIDTDFGTLDIVMNRWCPSDEVYILEKDYVGWITLRDWFVEDLAKDGDYMKSQIIGEFGFVLANEAAHAKIYNTATSA